MGPSHTTCDQQQACAQSTGTAANASASNKRPTGRHHVQPAVCPAVHSSYMWLYRWRCREPVYVRCRDGVRTRWRVLAMLSNGIGIRIGYHRSGAMYRLCRMCGLPEHLVVPESGQHTIRDRLDCVLVSIESSSKSLRQTDR